MTDASKRQLAKLLIFVAIGFAVLGAVLWSQAEKDAEPSIADEILGNPPPEPADHTLHVVLLGASAVSVVCSVILFASAKAPEREEAAPEG